MIKNNKSNKKRGYSLLEAVIALSLIAICFGMAMTAVVSSFKVRRRVMNTKYFIAETSNYLECYKMHGSADFKKNVDLYLGTGDSMFVFAQSDDGIVYVIYYDGDYNKLPRDKADDAMFVMYVVIEKSFTAYVKEAASKRDVYYLRDPYISRFDM